MKSKFFHRIIAMAACVLGFTMLICITANGQVTPTTYGTFTLLQSSLNHSNSYTVTSDAVRVRKDRGLGILASLAGAAATTNGVSLQFQVSADGTTYSTYSGLNLDYNLANSTNTVVVYQNFPATTLNNVRYLRLATITATQTNTVTVNSVTYSYHN